MFLVLNTSGLTVIPLAIIADRATLGSLNPTSIFIPTLIATFCSTIVGLIYLSFRQKIKLLDPVLLGYLGGLIAIIGASVFYFSTLTNEELQSQSTLITSIIILTIIILFLSLGLYRRIPLFETFVEGAKEGFETSVKIIPFLIAFLVAIGVFRSSGALTAITDGVKWSLDKLTINSDFVDALPVALLKPLTGQGARTMMIEVSKTFGPDSFVANLSSIFRGCAETTFYILAVYFGSVSVRKTRYALSAGLIADAAGVIAAIFVGYLFFH
jgi:spore maturation protein SpmB